VLDEDAFDAAVGDVEEADGHGRGRDEDRALRGDDAVGLLLLMERVLVRLGDSELRALRCERGDFAEWPADNGGFDLEDTEVPFDLFDSSACFLSPRAPAPICCISANFCSTLRSASTAGRRSISSLCFAICSFVYLLSIHSRRRLFFSSSLALDVACTSAFAFA